MNILGCMLKRLCSGRAWKGFLGLAVSLGCLPVVSATAADISGLKKLTFERDVRPILRAHCIDCHGSQGQRKGGLDLRLVQLMQKGGESGPAITPAHPDESYLLDRVKSGEMPPGDHKLSSAEVATLESWIRQGALTARTEPADPGPGMLITEEDRDYWAFRPLARPAAPNHTDAVIESPIDAFLLQSMRRKGLTFSQAADRRTLIRRLSFDLVGLPPRPDDIAAFVTDQSPDAYERLVNRLLASPQYGERWGRHWLDVAGYADSEGYDDQDTPRPQAYKYRDYVIRALNANKPFNEFLIEQLAGDELVPRPYANMSADAIDKLTATGFLRMAADGTETAGSNQAVASNQMIADTIKIVSTSLLGVSVGCAQCHDHRYDPIAQEDYYRLRAVFEPAFNWKNWRVPTARRVSLMTDGERAQSNSIEAEVVKFAVARNEKEANAIKRVVAEELKRLDPAIAAKLKPILDIPADKRTKEQAALLDRYPSVLITAGTLYQYDPKAIEELKKDDAHIASIRAKKPVEDFLRVTNENPGEMPDTFLFFRGEHVQPKQKVEPGDLTVCVAEGASPSIPLDDPNVPTTGRRLAYAKRLTSGKHPLVGRVLANRIWLHHFGRGLVNTPADFGRLGEKPTHPELLDWLATEFAGSGWNLKHMHRLIVTSTAYRQSAVRTPERDAADPENLLLSRMNVRRIDAESLRDAYLTVTGKAYGRMYGPPVPVKEDAVGQIVVGVDTKVGANTPGADVPIGGEEFRRSVYVEVRRSKPLAILRSFDAPVMETNCDRRVASTSAPQALMLMNSDFALSQSQAFADRLRRNRPGDVAAQIKLGYELASNRIAEADEVATALAFLDKQTKLLVAHSPKLTPDDRQRQALTDFCQSLLGSNEFLYTD